MRRHRVESPAHSHVIHPGDPPEEVFVQHSDGSFSEIIIQMSGDQMDVTLRPALTHDHDLRLHGLSW